MVQRSDRDPRRELPHADHVIADVSNYDMRRLPDSDVLWASPICTELSPAGGRRRKHSAQLSLLEPAGHVPTAALDRTRATFWDVVRATEVHRYKVILIVISGSPTASITERHAAA